MAAPNRMLASQSNGLGIWTSLPIGRYSRRHIADKRGVDRCLAGIGYHVCTAPQPVSRKVASRGVWLRSLQVVE